MRRVALGLFAMQDPDALSSCHPIHLATYPLSRQPGKAGGATEATPTRCYMQEALRRR
jgi:hypothetical protein